MIRRLAPGLVLAAVVLGVAVGTRPGASTTHPVLLAIGLAVGAGAAAHLDRRGLAAGCVLAALLAAGAAAGARAVDGLERSPLVAPASSQSTGELRGAVVGDPIVSAWRVAVVVRSEVWVGERAPPRAAGARAVLVVAGRSEWSRVRSLVAGDRVAVRGRLGPLDGFDARLRWRHVVARLDGATLVTLAPGRAPLLRVANAVRAAVERGGAGLPARERGVLAAFLLGDERAIPPETVETFRAAGMSHLLVVSGANVAAVLALVGPVTRRAPLLGRLLIAGSALAVFGAATRWEPSVLRAVAMALVVLVGAVLGRPVHGIRVLCLAVSVLLLLDPFLLHSVGFLLSCAATAGIALLAHRISRRVPGPAALGEAIAVTVAAQIGVAPVLVPAFGSMPAVALPANLLAAPFVVPITAWGLVAGLLGGLLGAGAAQVLQAPTYLALRTVEAIAELGARHPGSLDGRAVIGLSSLLAAGAAAVRWRGASAVRRTGSGVRTRR